MAIINCPWCAAKVIEQPEWITMYYDPKFHCRKCGKDGTLSWSAGESSTRIGKVKKEPNVKVRTVHRRK